MLFPREALDAGRRGRRWYPSNGVAGVVGIFRNDTIIDCTLWSVELH